MMGMDQRQGFTGYYSPGRKGRHMTGYTVLGQYRCVHPINQFAFIMVVAAMAGLATGCVKNKVVPFVYMCVMAC